MPCLLASDEQGGGSEGQLKKISLEGATVMFVAGASPLLEQIPPQPAAQPRR